MWEEREQKLNMVGMTYWLIALHLYPQLSQRAVYAKLVSGLRTLARRCAAADPGQVGVQLSPGATGQ